MSEHFYLQLIYVYMYMYMYMYKYMYMYMYMLFIYLTMHSTHFCINSYISAGNVVIEKCKWLIAWDQRPSECTSSRHVHLWATVKYFTNAVHLCQSLGHHEHLTFNPYLLTGGVGGGGWGGGVGVGGWGGGGVGVCGGGGGWGWVGVI